MKLLADEGVDRAIVQRLRQDQHPVLYVAEMKPGISDVEVLDLANREEAILVTADKDFGELVYRQGRVVLGVILLRLAGLLEETKADVVSSAIADHADELLQSFAVIEPGYVRIRRKTSQ